MTKTTWTAQTKSQLVAALARKGWSRDSVRDVCRRAARDGFAMTTDNAAEMVALVTFGDTEVDMWDAEIMTYDEGMDKGIAIVKARDEARNAKAAAPASPYVVDPMNPTDDELAAAIERGLADGSLITAEQFMAQVEADEAKAGPQPIPGTTDTYTPADALTLIESKLVHMHGDHARQAAEAMRGYARRAGEITEDIEGGTMTVKAAGLGYYRVTITTTEQDDDEDDIWPDSPCSWPVEQDDADATEAGPLVADLDLIDTTRVVEIVSAEGITWAGTGSADDVAGWLGNCREVDREAIRLAVRQVAAQGKALRISFPSVQTFTLGYSFTLKSYAIA